MNNIELENDEVILYEEVCYCEGIKGTLNIVLT